MKGLPLGWAKQAQKGHPSGAKLALTFGAKVRSLRAASSLRTNHSTQLRSLPDLRQARRNIPRGPPARWPDILLLDGLIYDCLKITEPVGDRLVLRAGEQVGCLPAAGSSGWSSPHRRRLDLRHAAAARLARASAQR